MKLIVMSDVKPGMERVTISLPPALLERIDKDRARAGGKRSTFIVKVLESYYRKREHDERGELRAALIELMHENPELFRVQGGEGEGGAVDAMPIPLPMPVRVPVQVPREIGHRRPRGDSIAITDDMKELMSAFMNNPDRPVRSELRRDYQVDTSDLPRWLSGEKPRMRKETWLKLKPILEEFAGK